MTESTECCGTCRFWSRDNGGAGGATRGLCRPHPPEPRIVRDYGAATGGELRWLQPHTHESEWCGEHEKSR